MHVDAWISQPIAFWSSLAYLVPIFFLRRNNEITRLWSYCLVLLTVSSMFCHASFIRLGVAMDFASIGIIMGFFPLVKFMKGKRLPAALAVFFILQLLVNFGLSKWPKIALSIIIFLFAMAEVILSYGKNFLRAKNLHFSLLILTLSFLLFLLDDQKIFFCDHTGRFAGHTLWHLGTAVSIYYYGKWRFSDEKSSALPG